jgi:hypothetical protein
MNYTFTITDKKLEASELYNEIFENLEEFKTFPFEYKVRFNEALPYFCQSQAISLLAIVQDNYNTNQAEIKAHKEAGNETSWSFIDEDGMVDSDSVVSEELQNEYNKEEVWIEFFNSLLGKINIKFKEAKIQNKVKV